MASVLPSTGRGSALPRSWKAASLLASMLLPVVSLIWAPGTAQSESTSYTFSGVIDNVYDPLAILKGSVVAGSTPFRVDVVFDSDARDSNQLEAIAQYRSTGAPFGFMASVGGTTYSTDDVEIDVGNDNPDLDVYSISSQSLLTANPPFPDEIGHLFALITLSTYDLTTLTDTELPHAPLDPSDFERSQFLSCSRLS